MKKVFLTSIFLASSLFCLDFTTMTTDELNALKGTVPTEDKAAFQSEMKSRMQSLSPEERAAYTGTKQGSANGQKLKDGTGGGNMYKGSMGGKR